ncbi:MAG: pseudouridylate synthase [Prevotella sp.]|nr:pseudouridylate synthase [Prevotella sp.]
MVTEESLRSIDIHELLPQQEPFVMIGKLTAFDEKRTVTETVIKEDNIFVSNGEFSASGLVENIAQTCAARIGYVNKYILKKGIQLGFIGAIRNLEITGFPKVGDVITTCVTVIDDVLGMTLANAVVTCNGETLATTEIKIAVKEAE